MQNHTNWHSGLNQKPAKHARNTGSSDQSQWCKTTQTITLNWTRNLPNMPEIQGHQTKVSSAKPHKLALWTEPESCWTNQQHGRVPLHTYIPDLAIYKCILSYAIQPETCQQYWVRAKTRFINTQMYKLTWLLDSNRNQQRRVRVTRHSTTQMHDLLDSPRNQQVCFQSGSDLVIQWHP